MKRINEGDKEGRRMRLRNLGEEGTEKTRWE